MAESPIDSALIWCRLTFAGPLATIISVYFFVTFLRKAKPKRSTIRFIVIGLIIAVILSQTPYMVTEVVPRSGE